MMDIEQTIKDLFEQDRKAENRRTIARIIGIAVFILVVIAIGRGWV